MQDPLKLVFDALPKGTSDVYYTPMGMGKDHVKPFNAPPKIGRNSPCPCGSGKKYKRCCYGLKAEGITK
jgi:uncharacterized protein YecA (UPF0149 family)